MYHSLSLLQKRLHSFAEENNIRLLKEDEPELSTRLRLIKIRIEEEYAKFTDRPNS